MRGTVRLVNMGVNDAGGVVLPAPEPKVRVEDERGRTPARHSGSRRSSCRSGRRSGSGTTPLPRPRIPGPPPALGTDPGCRSRTRSPRPVRGRPARRSASRCRNRPQSRSRRLTRPCTGTRGGTGCSRLWTSPLHGRPGRSSRRHSPSLSSVGCTCRRHRRQQLGHDCRCRQRVGILQTVVLVLHGIGEPDDDRVGALGQQQEQSSERRPRHGWTLESLAASIRTSGE